MKNLLPLPTFSWRAVAAALVLSLAVFSAGCGDDDEPAMTTADDTEKSLEELSGFGEDALNQPGAQVLNGPEVTGILNVLPISLPGFLSPARMAPFRPAASPIPPAMPALLAELVRPAAEPLEIVGFGTYHYDSTNTAGQFEHWVLETPDVPEDGYIFKFTEDDGFFYLDEDSNRVDIQGEIRLLGVQWDEGNGGPLDDVVTHFTLEIAAGTETPATPGAYPVLLHVEATLTLDETREVASVRVGDRTANGTTDPEAAFMGHFLFALEVDVTRTAELADVGLLLQLYDSLEDYVLRVATDVTGLDEESGSAEAITLILGYGETTTPESPPWLYTVTLDNFRPDPTEPDDVEDEIADVDGTITLNGDRVATIFGTTDELDFDEDGESDCINTWVTFEADPGRPVSICVLAIALLQAFGEFVPAAVAPLVM